MRHHYHNKDCKPTICPHCGCCEFCDKCGCSGTNQCADVGCICDELASS